MIVYKPVIDLMLVNQGAKAFEIWTGKKAPLESMKESFLLLIESNNKEQV